MSMVRGARLFGLGSPSQISLALAALIMAASPKVQSQSLAFRGDLLSVGQGRRPTMDSTDTRSEALIYQYISLATEDLAVDGIHVELVGMVGGQIAEGAAGDGISGTSDGDVLVGVVRWENRSRSLSVSLGRQYLFAGGGRAEHLDGATVTYRVWHLDLSAFGGRTHAWQWSFDDPNDEPEEPAFASYAVGGRARFRLLDHGVASVAFVHEGDGAQIARQLVTFDVGYWRLSWMEALAGGIIDVVDGHPQEMWAELIFRPLPKLKLSGGYSYLVPGLAIPKTSLFSVFSVDAYHDISLQAFYGFNHWFMGGLEGGLRYFPDRQETVGYWVAMRGRIALGSARERSIGFKAEYSDEGNRRHVQGRLYGLFAFLERRLYCRADVFALGLFSDNSGNGASAYERAINATPISIGGIGMIGWRFASGWNANVASSFFSTPRASSDLRIMGRLTYAGNWSWH